MSEIPAENKYLIYDYSVENLSSEDNVFPSELFELNDSIIKHKQQTYVNHFISILIYIIWVRASLYNIVILCVLQSVIF